MLSETDGECFSYQEQKELGFASSTSYEFYRSPVLAQIIPAFVTQTPNPILCWLKLFFPVTVRGSPEVCWSTPLFAGSMPMCVGSILFHIFSNVQSPFLYLYLQSECLLDPHVCFWSFQYLLDIYSDVPSCRRGSSVTGTFLRSLRAVVEEMHLGSQVVFCVERAFLCGLKQENHGKIEPNDLLYPRNKS